MPKLIDYGVRFELMREAVVRLAASHGAGAVTLARVAAELKVSSDTLRRTLSSPQALPILGVEAVARRRHHRRVTTSAPRAVGAPPLRAWWAGVAPDGSRPSR